MVALAAAAPAARAAPEVVASIRPLHALVATVMAGVQEPVLLIEGVSAHGVELRPSQAAALERADLVVLVGAGLEAFAERWAGAAGAGRVLRLADLAGVEPIPTRAPGPSLPAQDAGAEGDSLDPHLWLDPEHARRLVDAVAAALAALDPEHAGAYRANRDRAHADLDALDRWIEQTLEPVRERPFVVAHDAYRYFTRRYGLREIGVLAVEPDRVPGVRTMRALRERLAAEAPACVFTEAGFPAALTSTLIEGLEVEVGTLDPVGATFPAGPDQYDALMRGLTRSFVDCLGRLPAAPDSG